MVCEKGANDLSLFLCLWQAFEIQQEESLQTKKVRLKFFSGFVEIKIVFSFCRIVS